MVNDPWDERSTGELVKQLSEQTSRLVRQELELAKVEMKDKGKRAGIGASLLTGAAVTAFYAGGALLFTIGLALAEGMDAWLAALIVTVVLVVVAGVLALIGRSKVADAAPLAPEQAVTTTKESIETVKARARHP